MLVFLWYFYHNYYMAGMQKGWPFCKLKQTHLQKNTPGGRITANKESSLEIAAFFCYNQ